jgi:hypothetical protein
MMNPSLSLLFSFTKCAHPTVSLFLARQEVAAAKAVGEVGVPKWSWRVLSRDQLTPL